MKKFALLVVIAGLLSGCITAMVLSSSNGDRFPVDTATVPASGVYAVNDVVVEDRGRNDMYRLVAAAKQPFTQEHLLAVLWCRAAMLAKEKGFEDWKLVQVAQSDRDHFIASEGLVQLLHTPPAKPEKNWCAVVSSHAREASSWVAVYA